MNIIFFGSSDFSIPVLSSIERSAHQIVCVVTTPPRKKGRGQKKLPTVVQEWAQSKSIQVIAPEKINTPEFTKSIQDLAPDCLIVASYGKMIPDSVLKIPKHYPLNVHPSLLPKYRGAAPIARQILNGETKSGVTIARITSKLDAGEIIAQKAASIFPDDNGITLSIRLAKLGGELALEVLEKISKNKIQLTAQNDSDSTYADKLKVEMGRIQWNSSADQILRQIRGLIPWPGAFTYWQQLRIKILEASKSRESFEVREPGAILSLDSGGHILVQTEEGAISLKTVQPESGKAMTAHAFAVGRHLKVGDLFS